MHDEVHPLSGQVVTLSTPDPELKNQKFLVEDWWDHLTGGSWMWASGNPAATAYAIRSSKVNSLGLIIDPEDDEVIYGKVGAKGYLVHESELTKVPAKVE